MREITISTMTHEVQTSTAQTPAAVAIKRLPSSEMIEEQRAIKKKRRAIAKTLLRYIADFPKLHGHSAIATDEHVVNALGISLADLRSARDRLVNDELIITTQTRKRKYTEPTADRSVINKRKPSGACKGKRIATCYQMTQAGKAARATLRAGTAAPEVSRNALSGKTGVAVAPPPAITPKPADSEGKIRSVSPRSVTVDKFPAKVEDEATFTDSIWAVG